MAALAQLVLSVAELAHLNIYTPSQLIQDARRRGVVVVPVDVAISTWDFVLEGDKTAAPVRLGMSLIKGMRAEAAERIQLARAVRPFVDVADLARRAALDRHNLAVLAHASARRSLAKGNRRNAIWTAAGAVPDKDILRGTERDDEVPALPQASEGSEIVTDYRAMGFTLGRHPLELLRDRLRADRLLPARELAQLRNGQFARACGIVTVRQRPARARMRIGHGTAAARNGERRAVHDARGRDGQVNVILWPGLLERFRKEALGAALLAVCRRSPIQYRESLGLAA